MPLEHLRWIFYCGRVEKYKMKNLYRCFRTICTALSCEDNIETFPVVRFAECTFRNEVCQYFTRNGNVSPLNRVLISLQEWLHQYLTDLQPPEKLKKFLKKLEFSWKSRKFLRNNPGNSVHSLKSLWKRQNLIGNAEKF